MFDTGKLVSPNLAVLSTGLKRLRGALQFKQRIKEFQFLFLLNSEFRNSLSCSCKTADSGIPVHVMLNYVLLGEIRYEKTEKTINNKLYKSVFRG